MKNPSKNMLLTTIAVCGILLLPGCFHDKGEPAPQAVEQVEVQEVILQEIAPQEIAPQEAAEAAQPSATRGVSFADKIASGTNAVQALRESVSKGNVVVDFYAPWCGPCKMMSPIIDELAKQRSDITFIKIDIDKFEDISNGFEVGGKRISVKSIPTFYLFKDGKVIDEIHGGMNKEAFVSSLNARFGQ